MIIFIFMCIVVDLEIIYEVWKTAMPSPGIRTQNPCKGDICEYMNISAYQNSGYSYTYFCQPKLPRSWSSCTIVVRRFLEEVWIQRIICQ